MSNPRLIRLPTAEVVQPELWPKPIRTPARLRISSRAPKPCFETDLGKLFVTDCLSFLRGLPDESLDLVITSPPYDGQPKYGNGEKYERDWYEGFFLEVTREILRTLKRHGSFVLNYRSKRRGDERGTIQYELVFWLRRQGFLFW